MQTEPKNPQEDPEDLLTSSYDYHLPDERIAQVPAARREEARLLRVGRASAPEPAFSDHLIADLPHLLRPGDLLVLNDTRVLHARLFGVREATGGRVEVLVVEPDAPSGTLLMLRARGRPQEGESLLCADGSLRFELREALGGGLWRAAAEPSGEDLLGVLETRGTLPLPPYIRRERDGDPRRGLDEERYQTVFARRPGAVAAPTAGLHLTPDILSSLDALGIQVASITLHVGPGTFRPVTSERITAHPMHEERFEIPPETAEALVACRKRGDRIVAVGTTTVRVLEAAAAEGGLPRAGAGRTRIFIHPPHTFRCVDMLLTNFHAPRSTLLMLVSALAGRQRILQAYEHALRRGYRFLSYGDAMLIG